MQIRPVRPGEGAALRALRLRALADAPQAFGRDAGDDADRDDGYWDALAAEGRVVVADDGDRWAGMAGGRMLDAGRAELWGMWVDPGVRGTGLAEALIDAVAAWARAQGAAALELQVADPTGRAARTYRRLGFGETGRAASGGCRLRLVRAL